MIFGPTQVLSNRAEEFYFVFFKEYILLFRKTHEINKSFEGISFILVYFDEILTIAFIDSYLFWNCLPRGLLLMWIVSISEPPQEQDLSPMAIRHVVCTLLPKNR